MCKTFDWLIGKAYLHSYIGKLSADAIHKEMSQLFRQTSECTKESLKMKSQGSHKPTKKSAMKMKERRWRCFKIITEGKDFMRLHQKTGWTNFNGLWVIDSRYNRDTNIVTSNLGWRQWFFAHGCTNEHHQICSGWYVLKNSGVAISTIVDLLVRELCNN